MPDANALFRAISRDDYSPSPLLAKVVLDAAIDGDAVASQIAATAGTGLAFAAYGVAGPAGTAAAVHRRALGRRAPRGLPRRSTTRSTPRSGCGCPTCPVHLLEAPPAAGAALLALDRLGHVDVHRARATAAGRPSDELDARRDRRAAGRPSSGRWPPRGPRRQRWPPTCKAAAATSWCWSRAAPPTTPPSTRATCSRRAAG